MLKTSVQNLLAYFAKKILAKYQPKIIGITGSVGKSSTKEAVFLVVSQKYFAGKSEKSFNGELGLPLSIIGIKADPQKNIFAWIKVMLRAVSLIIFKTKYPEILVLEYGVDHIGDMDHLLSIARPNIGVITNIGISHFEFFQNVDAIATEKGKIAQALKDNETLIVNADNSTALEQQSKTQANVLSYGFKDSAKVRTEITNEQFQNPLGAQLSITTPTRQLGVTINALGQPHYLAVTAAVAVGEALNIETDLIIKGLQGYRPSPGRLNIIAGIKHSTIIDDTYNASPDSMRVAIDLFQRLQAPRKIAILGTMRELGTMSGKAHQEIGEYIARIKPDFLVTVGDGGKLLGDTAIVFGQPAETVLHFHTSDEAKKTVQDLIQPDCLVLAKGSQNTVRLEKIVKKIMAEPMHANDLLIRQYNDWLK
jgi:UDP-N-acetylmuramoyl-tripeptide--D-alanyl-D-alanine ligase